MHGMSADRRALEREALRNVIQQWNANRLDIFELSEPNEELEFHGVMRFYFQDSGQKVATKCIRVASDATVEDVIGTLIEKFRPDMRMLSVPSYALFELHEHCAERKMAPDEKPLLVQLNWHVDDREGRFLLRNIDDKTLNSVGLSDSNLSFKRKLSKREKKQLKKQEKLSRMKSDASGENEVAEKLYSELPETSFTRSISNPEAVMRRRRQQKLERKLQQFRSKDGGPDTGGTLKIYGEALCRDVPYKTLLLSVRDTAGMVVREMLDKYGQTKVDPQQWCLVQVTQGTQGGKDVECVLDDDECPLGILMNAPTNSSIMFHVRRRPPDCAPRKRKKKPGGGIGGATIGGSTRDHHHHHHNHRQADGVPILVELGPDGSIPHTSDAARTIRLNNELTEVGSSNGIALQLYGPHIQPRHCVITASPDGLTALTPCHADAHTYVNGQRIHQTTALAHGALVKFGNSNTYRYLDPLQELDGGKGRGMGGGGSGSGDTHSLYDRSPQTLSPNDANKENFETTFDVEGNVETISTASGPKEDSRSIGSASENRLAGIDRPYTTTGTPGRGQDPILPAVLEFPEEHQDQFLARVITHLDVGAPTFRLSPAFTLYLCGRYRASTHYRPELTPTERAHKLTLLLQHAAMLVRHTVQDRSTEAGSQAFWLANASELLHFLKSDRHVSAFSLQAQDTLADAVQLSFKNLVACLTDDLNSVLITLLSDGPETCPQPIVDVLGAGMQQFRNCRVNAALTIQFFSQLFHWLSARALSVIMNNPSLCCRAFGLRLGARLRSLQMWAESQGLELAAECHLSKVIQCATLLQANKGTAEELARLSAACFKLNSLQLRALLTQYKPEPGEPIASASLLDQAARAAEDVADELARADGREVRLHDDPTLHLQLLLPDDGYSCDVVVGVPPGLADFLLPLQAGGLCRLAAQPTSSGQWTVYMTSAAGGGGRPGSAMSTQQPELQVIRLHKAGGGMGLSIVAAKGAGQERLGIYIKSVVPGGAADRDGRLAAGDQLLSVDGQSLLGITQEKAAEFLVRTASVVTLSVAKGGAVYHGLATLLQQPSPTPQRGGRRMSERDLPSRVDADSARIPSSKSVPALHHISPNSDMHPHHPQQQQQQQQQPQLQHPHTLPHSTGGSVAVTPTAHDNFNPGYSRTSSSNSIHQQQMQAMQQQQGSGRSRSSHSLYTQQQQQQQQQQQDGFYQNLSVYRNSGGNGSENSPKQLGDRTSAHRISQNSLHTASSTTAPAHAAQQQQQQQLHTQPLIAPQLQQQNRPVSAYYTTSTAMDGGGMSAPSSGRLPLHLSIPNLKSAGGGNHPNSPHYQQQLQQQGQLTPQQHMMQYQQQRTLYNTTSYPNMTQQQQQQLLLQQQQHQQQFGGYGSPTQSIDGAYNSPNGGYALGHQGLLQEDLKYNMQGRQEELGGYRRQENGYGATNGEQLMRTSKSEDLLRQSSQPNLQHAAHEQLRYASSVGNVTRAQESSRVELPQLRHGNTVVANESGGGDGPSSRGQAKFMEMGEELRRRQQREQQHHLQQPNNMYVNKPTHPQHITANMQNLTLNQQQQQQKTPPVAPKPPLSSTSASNRLAASKPIPAVNNAVAVVEDAPELPPTSTHPLYAASGSAGKSGGRDPWVREEREREAEVRREQARHWQEQQIRELQAMQQRTVQQDEQLRVLRLEREFQRRALEAAEQEEEDTEKDSPVHPPQQQQQPRHQHQPSTYHHHPTKSIPNLPTSTPATVSILKHQQSAPNLIINNNNNNNTPINTNNAHPVQVPTSLSLSHNMNDTVLMRGSTNTTGALASGPGLGGVGVVGAPAPPERASSYQVMSLRNQVNAAAAVAVNRGEGTKRVSFNDVGSAGTAGIAVQDVIDNNRKDMVREDPDAFIRQAESMLASPTSPTSPNHMGGTPLMSAGATPGVIGAQEVYRDPRTRRLAEQAQQKTASAPSVPEKLTFKEKMKMFAMETGETSTPRDKSKISRAQRDIDNIGGSPAQGQQSANSSLVH